jgi:hypothetical protein
MGLQSASPRTKRRVGLKGVSALHAQGKNHKFSSTQASDAARKRWALKRLQDEAIKAVVGNQDRIELS